MDMTLMNAFPVIGIGASAGGLEPLEELFDHISPDSGYAYVIIQHLAPNHKSLMSELLARHTTIPIQVIEDGMELKPDHLYLNPPQKFIELDGNRFVLREKEDRKLSYPISKFFESLAVEFQFQSVAIVLSGTGSDGSDGIKHIKEHGGLVIAQDPETAKFDGMPNSAILTGAVDKICTIKQMPSEMDQFLKQKDILNFDTKTIQNHQKQIEAILSIIERETGVNFVGYKISTIYRRTVRRMGILGYTNIEEFTSFLEETAVEVHKLADELLIGVTRFFRDEKAFESITENVIPKLIEGNARSKKIRIWVPACSTGEEAYSLAMLFNDYLRRNKLQYEVTIFATDLDREAIRIAANRVFTESIVNEVPTKFFNSYFIAQKKGYTITKDIRDMVVFSHHNVIQDPPFSNIDLLSCRNFLIYLNNEIQQILFELFQFSLKKNGFLFLGSSETPGKASDQFKDVDIKNKIYFNANSKSTVNLRAKPVTINEPRRAKKNTRDVDTPDRFAFNTSKRLLIDIQEAIIQEFTPDTVVFSDTFELIHTTGRVSEWLKLPKGVITTNLVRMLPDEMSLPFELLANKVLMSGEPLILTNVKLNKELQKVYTGMEKIQIEIKRLPSQSGDIFLAASFTEIDEDQTADVSNKIDLSVASIEKIDVLERELRINQENLQTTIEELETSNEELQASNEELQSSNEELESVNEELYTVNGEFQEKVIELSESNNDLDTLIKSTDIAILFLDSNLQIRKYTPAVKKILQLMPQDIGRHITHFRSNLELDNFIGHVERVHKDLIPFESTVKDSSGLEYIIRISPFKTDKNEIKGVVISFVDVSSIAKANRKLVQSNVLIDKAKLKFQEQTDLFGLIANNISEMVSLHDLDGSYQYVSPSCYHLTGYSDAELIDMKPSQLLTFDESQKVWAQKFNELRYGRNAGLIKYQIKKKNGETRWLETELKQITESSGKVTLLMAVSRDVNSLTRMEEQVDKLSMVVEQTTNSVVLTDLEGKITFVNHAFESITGYDESEVLGRKPGDFLQGEETDADVVEQIRDAIDARKSFDVAVINYSKSGAKYWIQIHCEPMLNKDNQIIGFFSIQNEVTHQKEYEIQIRKLNDLMRDKNLKLEGLNNNLQQFAYIASHDLKAPLRNINGMIDLIKKKRDKVTQEKLDEYFDVIYKASKEMDRLIENLLEYSRSGQIKEDLERVELSEMMNEIEQTFKEPLQEIKGKLEYKSDVEMIRVYPILFKRLMTNLISNAIKYRSKKSLRIKIDCTENKKAYQFKVSDNGIGIAKDQFENIFNIFTTLQERDDSNGIGLSVTKTIAKVHKGDIWVESEVEKGSTFIFDIQKL